jgi:predicted DNA-binding transcriptional regulator AlpA
MPALRRGYLNRAASAQVTSRSNSAPASASAVHAGISLLTPEAASALLGLAVQTLARWRCEGNGPRFVRLGGAKNRGRVAYRLADLDAWVAERVVTSTSQRIG